MDGYHESQRPGSVGLTTKKGRKTSSKLRATPVSFADGASPKSPRRNGQNKERFSGLWEFFYDGENEMANGMAPGEKKVVTTNIGGGGGGGGEVEEEQEKDVLKNIRGFLFKRRKSPLKGWHKRYFTLQGGVLSCARNKVQMSKGKVLSRTNLGFAVITCDSVRWKIDIDEERQVYHLKTKNASHFAAWSSCLLAHELWKKAQLSGTDTGLDRRDGGKDGGREGGEGGGGEGVEAWMERAQETINSLKNDLDTVKECLEAMGMYVKSPVQKPTDRSVGDSGSEGVSYTQQNSSDGTGGGVGGGKEKEKRRWGRKKHEKRSTSKDSPANILSPDQQSLSLPTIPMNQSLPHVSSSEDTSIMEENIIRDDFSTTATIVFAHFKDMLEKWEKVQTGFEECVVREHTEKQKRQTLFTNQQLMLRQALVQNAELKDRLSRIQALASGLEPPTPTSSIKTPRPRTPASHSQSFTSSVPTGSSLPRFTGPVGKSLSRFDSFVSVRSAMSETFFDALDDVHELSSEEEDYQEEEGEYTIEEEHEPSDTEEEEEDSGEDLYASLTADAIHSLSLSPRKSAMKKVSLHSNDRNNLVTTNNGSPDTPRERGGGGGGETKIEEEGRGEEEKVLMRRTQLPCPTPEMADFSLWSILRKNIGKDLSRVSMPVSLNEPLSALQRLCEEVQYSELLDQAALLDNPYDRMVKVAAFAVSAYVTAYHRPARKPFNPILGETYEWVREDKGFKFMAEQVSHHPPIAACHCESPNFSFWEDLRIKSKFWGKSMEVLPVGTINVTIPEHGDHYEWEKVTSCIHNVLGGQRWVDQYGQMTITNGGKCSCKLTFVKASYWSSKKYQVHGDVYDEEGEKVRHLFGTWHEAMFCGDEDGDSTPVWQAAPMPEDSEQYYGFNQFAVQLNGIEEGMRERLPHTDSRFRPDQRWLEKGYIEQAEQEKHRVEQIQRQARAERERLGREWSPTFFRREMRKGEECWVSRGNYWSHRYSGFQNISLPTLW